MITFHTVHKTYQMGDTRVEALRGVSVSIPPKNLSVIMGPSGSGKSTFLHLAGCLDTPTSGRVEYGGRDLGGLTSKDRADFRATDVGFVFQKFNLIPNQSALRNVELPLLLRGEKVAAARKRAEEALAGVDLAARAQHRPSKLSGGEQQRVAIARALVNDPALILADEPTGNLDTQTGLRILDLLSDLVRRGKTVVVVTHNPEIAEKADAVVMLRDGQVESFRAPVRGGEER
ncbi:MAG: ABC transporter ATP-binding protein [Candidatus Bipolaricaulota bacterium]